VVAEETLRKLVADGLDYCSNCHPRTFPHGFDVECFTMDALRRTDQAAKSDACREHVTLYMYTTEGFRRGNYAQAVDQSKTRLTLDTIDDYVTIWNHMMAGNALD
jgi:spore coat polysaccharide biosynthesis protein SpsF (cytidylyltransferase family)